MNPLISNATVDGQISTKTIRVQAIKSVVGSSQETFPSESYVSNTRKEKMCLEIISNYRTKFLSRIEGSTKHDRHDKLHKLSLYLSAKNEYGVEKCVCTTIKPELLPYPQVHDAKSCADFLAHYLEYEPLQDDHPSRPPDILPSPTQVLSWGVGDCFDYSILLASFLLGAGYDAYIVYGVAPRWVCQRERNRSSSIFGADRTDCGEDEEVAVKNMRKYLVDIGGSSWEENDLRNKAGIELLEREVEGQEIEEKIKDEHREDSNKEHSVHCWVLVKPGLRRESGLDKNFFIEPSTGQIFPCVESSPYLRIFSVWNTKNFWMNLNALDVGIPKLDFNETEKWYPAFFNTSCRTKHPTETKACDIQSLKKQLTPIIPFDPPLSWVKKLYIPPESFSFRYPPDGRRTFLDNKVKVELFSQGIEKQGLLKRITLYSDRAKTEIKECREYFGENRQDHLIRRIKLPIHMTYHEKFSNKHALSVRECIEISGKRRIVTFHPESRLDGLKCRDETFGETIVEKYEGRHDNLLSRTINIRKTDVVSKEKGNGHFILSVDGAQNVVVTKITNTYQQFENSIFPGKKIARREFLLDEGKIETDYYSDKGSIEKDTVLYCKIHPQNETNKENHDIELHQQMIVKEKGTLIAIRNLHQEMLDFMRMRRREEDVLRIDVSLKGEDTGRDVDKTFTNCEIIDSEMDLGQKKADFLSPYLLFAKDPKNIRKDEAVKIRDACLKTMKDRLLERANIMQNRLYDENQRLAKSQASYQQDSENGRHSEEEFEKICSEAAFRIKILERRLHEHEEKSIEKYKDLELKIRNDVRLHALL